MFVDLVQLVAGLLEGILGSRSTRDFLFFFFLVLSLSWHLIHVKRDLLPRLEGSVRKEERGSVLAQVEQHLEAIKGSRHK